MSTLKSSESTYWLFGWLDSYRVTTVQQLRNLLGNPSCLIELKEVAEVWWNAASPVPPPGVNLVAGTGLRLDDLLTCPSLTCRRQQVDVLFRHAWHYFDYILLPDGVGDLVINRPENWDEELFLETLLGWIALVLYVRELGAIDLVHYYPKSLISPRGRRSEPPKRSSKILLETIREVETTLAEKGKYVFERISPSCFHVKCEDPFLEVSSSFHLTLANKKPATKKNLRAAAAHDIVQNHLLHLTEDFRARNQFNGTLGSTVWSHERIISRVATPSARDIALQIFLPSLSQIPINELVAVRVAEADSFAAFRTALTKAAQEMLDRHRVSSSRDAAEVIVKDVVQPELAKLRSRLRAAERALARKTIVSVALAGLTSTCGLLLGAGPAIAGTAGVGILASGASAAAAKHIEEEQSIRLSDMYFLWRALGHVK